jgi:hypothetical protein
MSAHELQEDEDEESTTFMSSPFAHDPSRQPDRRVNAFALIGGVADKALAMGRADEAERLLTRPLTEALEKALAGVPVDATFSAQCAHYATKLADATGRGPWIDYVFHLYTLLGVLLPAHIVDELYAVVRNVKIDRAMLRSYTELLRNRSSKFGPGERFVLQRIEGLERLGALK